MSERLFDIILRQEKERKKTEKQQKIVEKAISLFAEKGYANTSTAEIAKAAGVAEGSIFKHYGTKDQLLFSIVIPFLKESLPDMVDKLVQTLYTEETDLEQFLTKLAKDRAEFLTANREIFQVAVKEIIYNEELKKEFLSYFASQIKLRLTYVMNEFKKRGELVDRSADQLAEHIGILLGGFLVSRLLGDSKPITDEEIKELVRFALNGIKK